MKKLKFSYLACLLILSACGSAVVGINANEYWARSALKDGNSAAYMSLNNPTSEEDALIGASSDAAAAVELHLSQAGPDGVMQMIPQESILLPPGEKVELKPGSYHIMLISLKQDLNAGDEIVLTLHFEKREDMLLKVPVRDAAEMGGSGMEGHMP